MKTLVLCKRVITLYFCREEFNRYLGHYWDRILSFSEIVCGTIQKLKALNCFLGAPQPVLSIHKFSVGNSTREICFLDTKEGEFSNFTILPSVVFWNFPIKSKPNMNLVRIWRGNHSHSDHVLWISWLQETVYFSAPNYRPHDYPSQNLDHILNSLRQNNYFHFRHLAFTIRRFHTQFCSFVDSREFSELPLLNHGCQQKSWSSYDFPI